ncbi:hypothetical protein HDU80_000680 [Chytriomyces hyalinus]|nr:hypothetical protein HDU80_000680 [Chytriomyces hyalinus]
MAYYMYRIEMTTNESNYEPLELLENCSPYYFWRRRINWVVKPFVGSKDSAESVASLLVKLSVYFLVFPSHLDMLSTHLVSVHCDSVEWDATMTEPLILSAFLNYAANLNPYAIVDYLGAFMFAPIGSGNISALERGHIMELIIAVRFMQAWWLESEMEEFLPAWVTSLKISKPRGVFNCRAGGAANMFRQQLPNSKFPYIVLPPTNAGSDLWFSVFSCSVKTTSTAASKTSISIAPADCRQNLETMDPANWYKSQENMRAEVSKEIENHPFVHLRFELPDTASGMKSDFKSGPDGKNHVICVNLQSKFALKFFGKNFIRNYREFVRHAKSRFV